MTKERDAINEAHAFFNQDWSDGVDCNKCIIKKHVLFAHLTSEDLNQIHLPITDIELPLSEHLYSEGELGKYIYTIRSGLIKLEIKQANHSQKIVRLLSQGDITGLETLIGKKYHHTATVLEPCKVCKIPVEVIHNLQPHSKVLCEDIMERWDRSVCNADEWLAKLNTGKAKQRVLQFIVYLIKNSATAPEFALPSRNDMSSILGLTPETVSRIIADLKREDIIYYYGNGIYEFEVGNYSMHFT